MIDSTSDQKDIPWLHFISSTKYIECKEIAIAEFLLFVLTATLGGMFLCGANDLITIFKDVRSNEATTKYLLMGGASSSIRVHGFSWLYGSSGGEIELQEIVNGLINTQMYNSPGISITLIFITVGIGFKLSPAPSHQWTPDVYEGVRFDHPKIIISWLLRTNQIRWFYFSIFLTCSYGTKVEKIEKNQSFTTTDEGFLKKLWITILCMILGNLIAITQTSMKRMLAYSSIGQIGYVIIGIIGRDSNGGYGSMITYMMFYISMNLGTFSCIVLFGLRIGTDNIRDYAGLYTKDPFLALSLALCLLSLGGLYFLVSIRLLTNIVSIYFYLKIIKLLMTGRNQEITPHVRNYRRSPLRSNNSIELSMIVCVIASTIPGISINLIIAIAQDTLF
ncbi:hypothetical protein ES319_A13G099000v1 [Gossypium barbadense]|uniref:NADH:quinone oxidoreductase/Mrp antiporter transmembrane domain-containing protein n=1 Tax=Gossypium barbadense TaxID=3634 RepID=A0A5J5SXN8_GOSBA|nr:hypothetical protein ES319_A13G099000v1 [Gossypium barbadense]